MSNLMEREMKELERLLSSYVEVLADSLEIENIRRSFISSAITDMTGDSDVRMMIVNAMRQWPMLDVFTQVIEDERFASYVQEEIFKGKVDVAQVEEAVIDTQENFLDEKAEAFEKYSAVLDESAMKDDDEEEEEEEAVVAVPVTPDEEAYEEEEEEEEEEEV